MRAFDSVFFILSILFNTNTFLLLYLKYDENLLIDGNLGSYERGLSDEVKPRAQMLRISVV
jgi:hypothetical protein